MPIRKQAVILHLFSSDNVQHFRLRTRKEMKRYVNATIANKKSSRKHWSKFRANVRRDAKYWNKPTSYMTVHKMLKSPGFIDDCARDERFALEA